MNFFVGDEYFHNEFFHGDEYFADDETVYDYYEPDYSPDFDSFFSLFSLFNVADDDASENLFSEKPSQRTGHLTPDGTGTVVDNVFIDGNGLEFFTFKTGRGNTFYLVIDRMSNSNNVHFLNAVTEEDLFSLVGTETANISVSSVPPIPVPECPPPVQSDPKEETPTEPEQPKKNSGGINGTQIFLLMGVIALALAGYYVKIIRPKQRAADDDEGFDDYDESDDGDDYINYTGNPGDQNE